MGAKNRNLAVTNQRYCLICDRYEYYNGTIILFAVLKFYVLTFVSFSHTTIFYRY